MFELSDRRDRLFGRQSHLEYLAARASVKGLTAVVARPQMGKSWLLTELARRLGTGDLAKPHHVGYAELSGPTPDLLLRAVKDLYKRWLDGTSARQQLEVVWAQQKPKLLPGVARAITRIFNGVAGGAVGTAVEEGINGLLALNRDLTEGGSRLGVLDYDQALGLVDTVHAIGKRPVALFLDQWEDSSDPDYEARTLLSFLRHLDRWPPCHLFLALRPEEPAIGAVKRLVAECPGAAELYRLEDMDLTPPGERERLVGHVRAHVPAVATLSDAEILAHIDGYPCVVGRWIQRRDMTLSEDVARVADDTHHYRYGELKDILPRLNGSERKLALRLSLLPLVSSADTWAAVQPAVLDGLDPTLLDDLRFAGALEDADPPSFGHPKRREAVFAWMRGERIVELRGEATNLICALAAPIRDAALEYREHAVALRSFRHVSNDLNLDDIAKAHCQAAARLFRDYASTDDALIAASWGALADRAVNPVLLSMGLLNAIYHAKEEGDLGRRDALLAKLRDLAAAHPEDAAVRGNLANGLFNTLDQAKEENTLGRRDALLAELRDLAAANREDAAVREWLVKGLFNTLNHAKEEGDLGRRDALLAELRDLAGAHPEDTAVRKSLAMGLVNTLTDAKEEADPYRWNALLAELRHVAAVHSEDAKVRQLLTMGLVNTLSHAKEEGDLVLRDVLLEELRDLAAAHPNDVVAREWLVKGLFNTLNHAREEGDLVRRDALLAELRGLAAAHPDAAAVREWLAKCLFNTLYDAKDEGDLVRRDALLEELRDLAAVHPNEVVVREWLVNGLFNTLNDAKEEGDLSRRDVLLEELRDLAAAHPDHVEVRECLVKGLVNTLNHAKEERDLGRPDALLGELHMLSAAYSGDGFVQEVLKKLKDE